jgi:hypothetical protein
MYPFEENHSDIHERSAFEVKRGANGVARDPDPAMRFPSRVALPARVKLEM